MSSRALAVVLGCVVTSLAALSVAGVSPYSGPRILGLSSDHGVHLGDLPVLALWLVGMACVGVVWRRSHRQ
ncbi:hypothetical protein [Nocardioides deserti]|uniref:Uncharacterized protein n=1 Tax=Nocardioides deserti TaxID=1588644 RepID=A0ABR6UCZ6_9ACTN|nr:hypothetical protein [Nocardioides deserti]MBC2962325.1 hypothetical protein [Nocardioides deserti]GGO79193.1 hypothetical protein GCM10012276_38370 [Nocardioides deserti]